jgi:hypothetical protein
MRKSTSPDGTSLTVGEIRQDVERLRPRDPSRAADYDRWLNRSSAGATRQEPHRAWDTGKSW